MPPIFFAGPSLRPEAPNQKPCPKQKNLGQSHFLLHRCATRSRAPTAPKISSPHLFRGTELDFEIVAHGIEHPQHRPLQESLDVQDLLGNHAALAVVGKLHAAHRQCHKWMHVRLYLGALSCPLHVLPRAHWCIGRRLKRVCKWTVPALP